MKVTREHMTASSDHYKRIKMLQAIYQTSFPIFLILLLVIQIWVESTKNISEEDQSQKVILRIFKFDNKLA